jgi:hypothetical protein
MSGDWVLIIIIAGAAIMASEIAREFSRDAYRAVKRWISTSQNEPPPGPNPNLGGK